MFYKAPQITAIISTHLYTCEGFTSSLMPVISNRQSISDKNDLKVTSVLLVFRIFFLYFSSQTLIVQVIQVTEFKLDKKKPKTRNIFHRDELIQTVLILKNLVLMSSVPHVLNKSVCLLYGASEIILIWQSVPECKTLTLGGTKRA